jgi:hypothetical protein
MQNSTSDTNQTIGQIIDLETFGQSHHLLMNLSRYLDNAAAAVLAGSVAPASVAAFVRRAVALYGDLRERILALAGDGDFAARCSEMLRPLDGVEDPIEAALIADQAHTFLETALRDGAFTHRMQMLSLQLGLETAAASAQLGEQREKAQVFEHRLAEPKGSTGTYL